VNLDLNEFRLSILNTGDMGCFRRPTSKKEDEYIGLIINVDKTCSDGEVTYHVLCHDSSMRFFTEQEIIEHLFKI